ncbi:MAG: penicillin acylase family protein [Calditrichaeota bacterium]|nr:penicillin acylase family protein [Calditrichota bacterium]
MTIKKILLAVLVLFLVFITISTLLSYRMLKKSMTKEKGQITLSGLQSPVQVYRDSYGIPHIMAKNDHDLYMAAGFVTAQDRLWQLEMIRLAVRGELSTMLGDTSRHVDRLMRTMEFYQTGKKLFNRASEKSKAVLSAYTDGINQFIHYARGKYPVEFVLLNWKPHLWTPADVLAYGRLMSWELSLSWFVEWTAGEVRQKLGVNRAKELFSNYLPSWPTILSEKDLRLAGQLNSFKKANTELRAFLNSPGTFSGSNNWVVSGKKSKTGKPLLANDPHLPLANPSVWYAMQLVAPGVDVTGFSLVGSPGIIIGHNTHLAWGFTNVMADDADFYVETVDRSDSTRYRVDGKWKKMEVFQDSVVSRSGKVYRFERFKTRHGPVVTDVHKLMKTSGKVVSLKWTGYTISDETDAIYKMNRASNWKDFVQALRLYRSPAQNIVFADDGGNIGYWCTGAIPVRKGFTGTFPLNGATTATDWSGFIPFDQLPHVINPPEGFVASANNRVAPAGYPYYISNLWEPPARIQRIRELLTAKDKLSEVDFETIQLDVLSPFARDVTKEVLAVLDRQKTRDDTLKTVYKYLKGWDCAMRGESTAAAIFQVFINHLLRNTFQDELGKKLYASFVEFAGIPIQDLQRFLSKPRSRWFDDVRTPEKIETKEDQILRSLHEAVRELSGRLGSNPVKWRWDRLHHMTFRHVLGGESMLGRILNVGPFPLGGGLTTVNNARYKLTNPYDCWVGPSMRMIVDFTDLTRTKMVLPPGEVEHPLSRHFRDQAEMWVNGLYMDCKSDIKQVQEEGKKLVLVPAEAN